MPEGRRQREPAPSSPTPGLRAAAGGLRPAWLGGADGGSRSPGGKGGGAGTSGFSHLAHGLHRPPRGPLSDQRRGLPPGRPWALGTRFPPPPASPGLKIRVSKPPVTTRHEVPPHFAASGMRGVHLCGGIGGRKWRGTERALLAVRGPSPPAPRAVSAPVCSWRRAVLPARLGVHPPAFSSSASSLRNPGSGTGLCHWARGVVTVSSRGGAGEKAVGLSWGLSFSSWGSRDGSESW